MGIEPTQDASQRPANGFEDRGTSVRGCSSTSPQVRLLGAAVHDRPPSSAVMRGHGCHLGCQDRCEMCGARANCPVAIVDLGAGVSGTFPDDQHRESKTMCGSNSS
jgi:hypothetical protein